MTESRRMTWVDAGRIGYRELAPGIEAIDDFFPSSFLALQTTRHGGASQGPYASFNLATHVGDDPAIVAANRARLASQLPAAPLWLHQVHGTVVVECATDTGISGHMPPQADAAIAKAIERAAVVMTADCLPLLVARPATGQCAAIHAGWKGLLAGVVETTLDQMSVVSADANASSDDWYVWLGPAIGPTAFEVGADVLHAFTDLDPQAGQAFVPRSAGNGPKWMANLSWLAEHRLQRWMRSFRGAAIPDNNSSVIKAAADPGSSGRADAGSGRLIIGRADECTYRQPNRYFSFRRDRITGRMASLICRLS